MSSGFQLFDIILFAMIAAFLVLRLRSVLGRRTGNERRRGEGFGAPAPRESRELPADDDRVVALPPREVDIAAPKEVLPNSPEAGITQIKVADPEFDPDVFLQGGRGAFEMVVGAFARGDTDALRPLLNDAVFGRFADAIRDRETKKQTLETTVVAIKSADVSEAHMEGRTAFVSVRFVSDQINVLKDADGRIVEGDPNQTAEVIDVWTFARNTRSRDPNWLLVATETPQ
ncbi:MAG: Tim44/TimA family putative adaptor protein [Alphaproteobacteria bacterium]